MNDNRGGFTIFEVLIVMAVSLFIFISALALFRGKKSQTEFDQAMYDLQSKTQSVVNEVKSGSSLDTSAYTCTIRSDGKPSISEVSSSSGTNEDCITLGQAVQVISGSDLLTIYPVVGLKNVEGTTIPTKSLEEAQPEPVSDAHNTSRADATEAYRLLGGAKVVSAHLSGQSGNYDIASFYLVPQAGSSAGQGSTFTALAYPFTSTASGTNSPGEPGSENCIRLMNACASYKTMGQWDVCVHSHNGQQKATLSITNTPGGVSTKLTFADCS